ncbi:MAG TPA: response regulator transcription factor [Burkholderiaceae bacterium]|jgi:DNA-binding response OmpR family regulator|nr:response regulator transcription factor [Burkholderiaceae bacterium]
MTIACYIRDENVAQSIQEVLAEAGLDCEGFGSETALLRSMQRRRFSLILVDAGAESEAEQNILSWLNCHVRDFTPLVMMSDACSGDRVANMLDAGADEFIAKPVAAVELVARLRAMLRRNKRQTVGKIIEFGGYRLDMDHGTLTFQGALIELTAREFNIAWLLFSSSGQYLSRETISVAVWGVSSDIANRTIEQHVYMLRKKLQLSKSRGVIIRTGYAQGYRLEYLDDVSTAA